MECLLGLNVKYCEKLSLDEFGKGECKLPTSTVHMVFCPILMHFASF